VRHALADFIGCFVAAGPVHSPDDRPYIERFFGSIAANLSSRLPGYTGSSARDIRRALSDPKGDLRLYISLDEVEELLEAALATYNATPHEGLNGRTPLEAVEHSVRTRGAMLDWLPEAKRRTLCLMHTPRRVTVRDYLAQGQRPHVNFHGVRYTNALLASTAAFLGQEVRLYYNSQDLRTVRVFAADGGEIGILKAQGAWGEFVHDLKLRQEILRQRGRRRSDGELAHDFVQQYVDGKLARARRSRRAASEAAHTLRTLAAAPTCMTALSPATADSPDAALPSPVRVEPLRLSIGTGYVGCL
jgi:putative transposase